jgi:hypothetical protein
MIAAELAQRSFVQLKKDLAQRLGFRMPGGETLSVDLTQCADGRVSVFVADFTVAVDVAIVETFAHGALHCAYSLRASSCLDQMAILHRNRGSRRARICRPSRGDASGVREFLAPMMPKPGEDRSSVSDVFGNVYAHCIELMAGRAAERMLLEAEPAPPADDLRQARELAMLICRSEEAIETFIAHCDVAARDLLLPYGDVMMTLSIVLRIARTLDGAEIDKIISDVQARKRSAIEHVRRKRWQRVIENAAAFDHG